MLQQNVLKNIQHKENDYREWNFPLSKKSGHEK